MVWVGVVNVKVRSIGKRNLQESLTPRVCLHSRSALIAVSLSGLAGERSNGSSVMLKSPSKTSGSGRLRFDHLFVSSVQKRECLFGSFGAYTFIALRVEFCCHLKEMNRALPGISMCVWMLSALIISLFITKATPAEPEGLLVSGEFTIDSLLWYRVVVWSVRRSVRCVSCSARRPIFLSLIVLDTAVHFDIGPGPVDGDERPFMFRVAKLKFALYFLVLFGVVVGCGPFCGVGVGPFDWGSPSVGGAPRGSFMESRWGAPWGTCAPAVVGSGCIERGGRGGVAWAAGLCVVDILFWLVCQIT